MDEFKCADCGKIKPAHKSGDPGYCGYDDKGQTVCYECCAFRDAQAMRDGDRITLYLSGTAKTGWLVTNWPGTLKFRPERVTKSKHNIGGSRRDVRFRGPDGREWWGHNIGDSMILHCKKLKKA